MPSLAPPRHLVSTVCGVFAALLLIDCWVDGRFFDAVIMARYVRPHALLRDRTGGHNLNILFTALGRLPPRPRIAMIGDSTMNALDPDQTSVPYLLGRALQQMDPAADIQMVDCSEIGLYAGDAALFLTKLLPTHPDVVVWGAALRAFPSAAETKWVTAISDSLAAEDLLKLLHVGGGPWLRSTLSAEQILNGLVRTHWSTYAYRIQLRETLLQDIRPWLGVVSPLAITPAQLSPSVQIAPPARRVGPEWSAERFAPPNANWQALEIFGRLCATYAPGRCIIYAIPFNPVAREQSVEPAFYGEYVQRLRGTAERYGLIFRDWSDSMQASDFRVPKYGGVRDPIHLNEEGRAKLARNLIEPVREALAAAPRAVAPRHN